MNYGRHQPIEQVVFHLTGYISYGPIIGGIYGRRRLRTAIKNVSVRRSGEERHIFTDAIFALKVTGDERHGTVVAGTYDTVNHECGKTVEI